MNHATLLFAFKTRSKRDTFRNTRFRISDPETGREVKKEKTNPGRSVTIAGVPGQDTLV